MQGDPLRILGKVIEEIVEEGLRRCPIHRPEKELRKRQSRWRHCDSLTFLVISYKIVI